MRFTLKEINSIEATMDKLTTVAYTMWDRESTDGANARAIAYIISEMRACAQLVASDDRSTRLEGFDRIAEILNAKI